MAEARSLQRSRRRLMQNFKHEPLQNAETLRKNPAIFMHRRSSYSFTQLTSTFQLFEYRHELRINYRRVLNIIIFDRMEKWKFKDAKVYRIRNISKNI